MKAFQIVEWGGPAELRDVPVLEPGPGEILVKVEGAGACHSDLHIMDWPEGPTGLKLPFTLGHENAGRIEALGAGVDAMRLGEAVIVYGPWGCGTCRACRLSEENYCERQAAIGTFGGGLGRDGGMAEYMLVPDPRLLLPLGDLDPRDAAPLSDAALTPYHAIKRSLHLLTPGATIVVIGVGGLGHMAVQIARALCSAQVVAVDRSAERLGLARELGAVAAIESDSGAATTIMELTGGKGVELVLDFVGADETIALGAEVLAAKGHLTVVGAAGGGFHFFLRSLPLEGQLTAPYWGSAVELMEVLELARQGVIEVKTERFGLEQVDQAYERLRRGDLTGRAVICPHG